MPCDAPTSGPTVHVCPLSRETATRGMRSPLSPYPKYMVPALPTATEGSHVLALLDRTRATLHVRPLSVDSATACSPSPGCGSAQLPSGTYTVPSTGDTLM